jgi:hypothetical protein
MCRRLTELLDRNALGFLAALFVLYVLLFVEQVSAIWLQLPVGALLRTPDMRGWALGYSLLVLGLIAFYVDGLVVMRTADVGSDLARLWEWLRGGARSPAVLVLLLVVVPLLLFGTSQALFSVPDVPPEQEGTWWAWLAAQAPLLAVLLGSLSLLLPLLPIVAVLSAPILALGRRLGRPGRRVVTILFLAVALGNFLVRSWHGPLADSHRLYPLAGMACVLFGWLCLFAALWFAFYARWGPPAGRGPGQVATVSGRLLSLVLFTTLVDEGIWVLADHWPTMFSYRLSSIGAVFHLAFLVVGLASLVDIVHRESGWPVRQAVVTTLSIYVLFWLGPSPIPERPAGTAQGPQWYDRFASRLDATAKAADGSPTPVLFVAASGGGSRAAYFTALVFEALKDMKMTDSAGNPFYITPPGGKSRPATWADQIVLISSVSGGSLASAYYAHGAPKPWPSPAALRQSFGDALQSEAGRQYQSERHARYLRIWQDASRYTEDPDYKKRVDAVAAKDGDKPPFDAPNWMLASRFGDDMCMDFMAPLLRGVRTPGVDRGSSLSHFWEQRFGWADTTNLDGFGPRRYDMDQAEPPPLLLFNTTHARKGTRMVIGLPPLPEQMLGVRAEQRPVQPRQAALDPLDPHYYHTQTLADMDPTYCLSLADAVRLSANFPWGLPTARLKADVPPWDLLDGGVNDNTGIPALWEVVDHLENRSAKDPKALQILTKLRSRGVVFVEIDSGAKPSFKDQSEVFTPIQGLNNATYVTATAARGWYLEQLQQLLDPRRDEQLQKALTPERRQVVNASLLDTRQAALGQQGYRPMFLRPFVCNHADPSDVMTAWALAPNHKTKVLATFYCEYRQWTEIETEDFPKWIGVWDVIAGRGTKCEMPCCNQYSYQNQEAIRRGSISAKARK